MVKQVIVPEKQSEANVRAWLQYQGVVLEMLRAETDRCWFHRTADSDLAFDSLANKGVIEERYAGNHGENVVIGYRECVSRCAAQIIVHGHEVEIDFDHWQPWDLVGLVGHGIEVLRNKIGKKKTDPLAVARQLKKRGILDA